MKKHFIVFLLPFILTNAWGQSPLPLPVKQKIAAVENGLVPFYQVAGKPLVMYTLAERMKFYKVPTVSIALINNGKIEWVKAYGCAGPDNKLKANTETLFQIASQSKGITGTLAMVLVDHKLLTLDDDANNYLKSWKIPPSDFTKDHPETLRWLISGWSGMSVNNGFGSTI